MAGRSISTALVCGALVLIAALHGASQHQSQATQTGALQLVSSTRYRFPVSIAPVVDLYPGSTQVLAIRVTNPYGFAIRVTKVVVTIGKTTDHTGCDAAGNLVVQRQYSGKQITVRPRRTVTVGKTPNRPLLLMPAAASEACQGATFRIHVSGKAVRA